MGRMPKKGVEYFPHDVGAAGTPTMFTIQNGFGNDGYALWFKLLEHLGTKENLSMDCNDTYDWLYFVAMARVPEERAIQILDLLASVRAIDPDLWKQRIVWSENFAKRVSAVYKKRGTETPVKPDFCDIKEEKPEVPAPESTQRKVKKSKVKKSKEDSAEEKVAFAEFVSLKQTEYDKLVKEYGKAATEKFIEVLNNYKGANGKTYKSDYLAILNWVVERVKKNHPTLFKKEETSEHGNPFAEYR